MNGPSIRIAQKVISQISRLRCRFPRLDSRLTQSRIEKVLLQIDWAGVRSEGEFLSRPAVATSMKSEAVQSGGPGSYDYHIKVRFDVRTTMNL